MTNKININRKQNIYIKTLHLFYIKKSKLKYYTAHAYIHFLAHEAHFLIT